MQYEKPELDIILLAKKDVVVTSRVTNGGTGRGDGEDWDWD